MIHVYLKECRQLGKRPEYVAAVDPSTVAACIFVAGLAVIMQGITGSWIASAIACGAVMYNILFPRVSIRNPGISDPDINQDVWARNLAIDDAKGEAFVTVGRWWIGISVVWYLTLWALG